jgi:hypothetical protein
MRMSSFSRRLALFFAAAIPFVALPRVLVWSVGPLARTAARWCRVAVPDLSFPPLSSPHRPPNPEGISPDGRGLHDDDTLGPRANGAASLADDVPLLPSPGVGAIANRKTSKQRANPRLLAPPGAGRAHLFVGPESIQRAIPMDGRPTSAWTARTDEHPAGLLIQSPGALRGVIESGDILVEAEGQPRSSLEHLVATVRQSYEKRAR